MMQVLTLAQKATPDWGIDAYPLLIYLLPGHQPMTTEDGRYTIVFNGEIYNYKELSKELLNANCQLSTASDTEVLLKLYVLEGEKCLSKLRGMFAFAIWDEVEQKLFAARDRFGIKPLLLSFPKTANLSFLELKAIKHYKPSLSASNISLDLFLKTGSVPSPFTLYNETFSLYPRLIFIPGT